MKLSLRVFSYTATLVLAGIQAGQAEEIQLSPKFDPFQEASTTTFAAPEISLVNYAGCGEAGCGQSECNSGHACCGQQRHVGKDFLVCKERCGRWMAQVDLLLLRPYAGGNVIPLNTFQFETAYRVVVGRQNADGLGGRLRYFAFDHTDTGADRTKVEARYFDAELTKAVDFRRWGLLVSGGLRYAEHETSINSNSNRSGFDGFGLTFGTQAVRDLNCSGTWRMLMGGRWSALYGNSKVSVTGGPVTPQQDDLANILELNIGPQYRRSLRNGATLLVGGGLEAQYWSNVGNVDANAFTNDGAADHGFAGFTSSLTILR